MSTRTTTAHFSLKPAKKVVLPSGDPKVALVCDWDDSAQRAVNCQAVPWSSMHKNLSTAAKRLTNAVEKYV